MGALSLRGSCLTRRLGCFVIIAGLAIGANAAGQGGGVTMGPVVFATYVERPAQLQSARHLCESLRAYGGRWSEAPVWIYAPGNLALADAAIPGSLKSIGAELRTCETPEFAKWFFYGGKPFAAAAAEETAAGDFEILVWLDDDTVILAEPNEFDLDSIPDRAPQLSLAYCPVMHNRSGTLYSEAADPFWSRIYKLLRLTDGMLFPMTTPADQQEIRAYFHCGQLAVRPTKGILQAWAEDFATLCRDSVLVAMCRADTDKRVFLHQTALTGAVLHRLERAEMRELSDRYNYPIFFERVYGGERAYDSIEDVATIRCMAVHEGQDVDWQGKLRGPADRVAWLAERLR